MTDSRRQSKTDTADTKQAVGTSPTAHVGKTLESDPAYNEQPGRAEAEMAEAMTFRGGNDLTANPKIRAGSDPLAGTEIHEGRAVEPLKTRLPGDTSSDPHTDVGQDNATTMQSLPDMKTGM